MYPAFDDEWMCCEISWYSYFKVITHIEDRHCRRNNGSNIYDYKCVKCSDIFKTAYEFAVHFLKCHIIQKIWCQQCNYRLLTFAEYLEHTNECNKQAKRRKVNELWRSLHRQRKYRLAEYSKINDKLIQIKKFSENSIINKSAGLRERENQKSSLFHRKVYLIKVLRKLDAKIEVTRKKASEL